MTDHPKSNAELGLAHHREMLKRFPEEIQASFKSAAKMPLKDRVELLELQIMFLTMELQSALIAKAEREEEGLGPKIKSNIILPS